VIAEVGASTESDKSLRKSTEATFLLGMGAQKAGTSWLYNYIKQQPEADFGQLKEYHVWDALNIREFYDVDFRKDRKNLRRDFRDLLMRIMNRPREAYCVRRQMQLNTKFYFDYFSEILKKDCTFITGDFTPEHGALDVKILNFIQNEFENRGISTKAIFIMRDPVDRCLSAVRMWKKFGKSRQGVDIERSLEDSLLSYVGTRQAQLLTNYQQTINSLEKAFEPEDIYIGFYETMFQKKEIERLSYFIGTSVDYSFSEESFNTTSKGDVLSSEAHRQASLAFTSVYKFCFTRWPNLQNHWTTCQF
tara:strand:- start:87 stop:1001 length:915 start_codon:yes stop_codon:yes gene_type:complete